MNSLSANTITAIATPPGSGGIGIVRVSGPGVSEITKCILGFLPSIQQATYTPFNDQQGNVIDHGIALLFKAPHSFTGEDVLELQAHGGPIVLQQLLKVVVESGAVIAEPGEFSKRAFLNDKIDLVQAEAIADLIAANTEEAARSAVRSLQGVFSQQVEAIRARLVQLRMFVESSLDFPEEEIDFISESTIVEDIAALVLTLKALIKQTQQGVILKEGMTAVIAGQPNVGKSSLLNCLTQEDAAIVTDIPGTTRDVIRSHIHIDSMPLHIIDTAGLRITDDTIEQEGIKRTRLAMQQADVLLFIIDITKDEKQQYDILCAEIKSLNLESIPLIVIRNKIDLLSETPNSQVFNNQTDSLSISAKDSVGIEQLKQALLDIMGYEGNNEHQFIARKRHLIALDQTLYTLESCLAQFGQHQAAELLAEDLSQAQQSLNSITGAFTSDDLLGEIFSSFCIGK